MRALIVALLAACTSAAATPPAWWLFDGRRVCSVGRAPAAAVECASGALPAPADAVAVNADGRLKLVAQAGSLSLIDADGRRLAAWPLFGRNGRAARLLTLAHLPARRSFLVLLADIAEAWEIAHDPAAAPIFDGLVHDYRLGEAIARPGYLGLRRTMLAAPLRSAFVDARDPWFWAQPEGAGSPALQVVHLDVRRAVATLDIAAIGVSARWRQQGRDLRVLIEAGALRLVDPKRWTEHAGWAAPDAVHDLRSDAEGDWLWTLHRPADGGVRLTAYTGGSTVPAAGWEDPDREVEHWSASADGSQLLIAWFGAGGRSGLLWLDAKTLRPLQDIEGPRWRGLSQQSG